MTSLSKSNERKWSPFFLQKVDESLTVLKVNVKARVIKTREIYLLEWAIMAPSYELNPSQEMARRPFVLKSPLEPGGHLL